MMRFLLAFFILAQVTTLSSQDLHFHETGGFGTVGTFGLDGEVYRVTNMNNEGEGSLRYGLELNGPRLIVFEVGGIIDLDERDLVISNGRVTVAGQTAPYPGIILIKGGVRVHADNVLIQHLAVRPGDGDYSGPVGWEPDGFSVRSKNVVLDHCSVSWAIDENMSVANGGNDVTFYRCIVAEGLSNSIHSKGEHSCGSLVYFNSKNISIIGSLYAHNFRRHPRLADGSEVLFANNVIYNYGIYAAHIGPNVGAGAADPDDPGIGEFIGNAFFKGVDGWDDTMVEIHKGDFDKNNPPTWGRVYLEDNIGLDRVTGHALIQHDDHVTMLDTTSVKPVAFQPYTAYDNIGIVLKCAGARPAERSGVDARIVQSLIEGTGFIIDSQNEVGGYPAYDSTSRSLEFIPVSEAERRAWLDSISLSLEAADELDVTPLYGFIDEHLSTSVRDPGTISFRCYPNPATSHIMLHFDLAREETVQIYLVDMTGRRIYLERNLVCASGMNERRISLADHHLPDGMYLLVLANTNQTSSQKIVIKK